MYNLVFILTAGALIGSFVFLKYRRQKHDSRFLRGIQKLFYGGVILGMVAGIVLFILIQSPQAACLEAKEEPQNSVAAMIVLGAGIKNGRIQPILQERLDRALEVLLKKEEIPVIVSGGLGRGEKVTEAEAMGAYLVEHGVLPERIIYEKESHSTFENLEFSREKLVQLNAQQNAGEDYNPRLRKDGVKILLITSDFHTFRASLIARHFGFEPIAVCSRTPFKLKIGVTWREMLALGKDGARAWMQNYPR